MIKIYHASKEIFRDSVWYGDSGLGLSMAQIESAFNDGEYYLAGELDTDDLDAAYAQSQNVSFEGWVDGQRSTSVGDIIENDGGFYIVAPVSFDQMISKLAA